MRVAVFHAADECTAGRTNASQELGDIGHAIQIYEEVVQSYAGLYLATGADGLQKVYSLDALEKLAENNHWGCGSKIETLYNTLRDAL